MCFLAGAVWSKLLTQIAGPQQNDHLPAAAFLKLLKLLQPRASAVKICEVNRGKVTPARLLFRASESLYDQQLD
jgi:hypothetical protein